MWKDTQAVLKYKRGDASDHVPLEPEVPAQDANELWSVQRYSTEECDGRSNSSSTQVQLVMRGKRRFQEELNLNRLAVQFSAVQHRVSAASCGHDPEDDLDRNHAQVEEGCRDCPHFPSPHVNLTTRNHSTTRKSWRSDAPIILPGWEYHTGGSRSKPTVHRCRPKTGGCGLLTRTQNEPTTQHGSGVENQQFLSDLFILPFYFDLSFPVFFHSSVLMHPDLHTDLDNLDSVENNLRHSAKGSLDAYDVTFSLTLLCWVFFL